MKPWLLLSTLALLRCSAFDLVLSRDVQIETDIPYSSLDQTEKHRMDLFRPSGSTRATVLFIHGGYWRNQDRRYFRPFTGLYSNVGLALARRGITTAVMSYRLAPEASIEDQLADIRAAARTTARLTGAESIFLMGHSAGGHLALLAIADARLRAAFPVPVHGVVALSPILDIDHMARHQTEEFNRERTVPLFGTGASARADFSPVSLLDSGAPPILVLVGGEDYEYIQEQCAEGIPTLQSRSLSISFRTIANLEHADMVLKIGTGGDPISPVAGDFILENAQH